VERCPSFVNGSSKPLGELRDSPSHSDWISGLIQCIIGNELATLDRLKERVMQLSGDACAFLQAFSKSNLKLMHHLTGSV